jgi:hypothetical protein
MRKKLFFWQQNFNNTDLKDQDLESTLKKYYELTSILISKTNKILCIGI